VENPATSSPGLAFLLATVARFGTEWETYWKSLRANGVEVVEGWSQAYDTEFSGSAGKGPKPLVVSYASSPPAEVVFAPDPKPSEPPTASMTDGCFRQVEFVGILNGTRHEDEARKFVDFLIDESFQADMPLNMFVFPARTGVPLPDVFAKFAARPEQPLAVAPDEIAEHRDEWIEEWTNVVLR